MFSDTLGDEGFGGFRYKMNSLSWTLSPESFVDRLQVWKHIWARRSKGASGRRHLSNLVRRRVQWYRRIHRLSELPSLCAPQQTSAEWREVSPETLKIVIGRQAEFELASIDMMGRPERLRHEMRRRLYSLEREEGAVVELLASRRTRTRRKPGVSTGYRYGRRVSRGLFLEALGVAILPNLSEADVAHLESEGATVLSNEIVSVVDPTESKSLASLLPPNAWHLDAINVDAARAKNLTGAGVLIGVVDTGIDPAHPEFEGRHIHFRAFRPDGSYNLSISAKDYGTHGTHVAALCAGKTVGVAPEAELAVAAVLTSKQGEKLVGYRSQIFAGINWLARGEVGLPRPADIINASLGGSLNEREYAALAPLQARGVAMVAAVGNDGTNGFGKHAAPGMYDFTLAVGAVDQAGQIASFSAWGPCFSHPTPSRAHKPDVMAPGVGVVSAVPGAKYQAMNGTSMASPIVAGAGALLLQQDPQLRGDPDALGARISSLTTALRNQPTGYDARRGGKGALDLTSV